MKETNDKIVQEYIERAEKVLKNYLSVEDVALKVGDREDVIEIAKMVQLEDLHSRVEITGEITE